MGHVRVDILFPLPPASSFAYRGGAGGRGFNPLCKDCDVHDHHGAALALLTVFLGAGYASTQCLCEEDEAASPPAGGEPLLFLYLRPLEVNLSRQEEKWQGD